MPGVNVQHPSLFLRKRRYHTTPMSPNWQTLSTSTILVRICSWSYKDRLYSAASRTSLTGSEALVCGVSCSPAMYPGRLGDGVWGSIPLTLYALPSDLTPCLFRRCVFNRSSELHFISRFIFGRAMQSMGDSIHILEGGRCLVLMPYSATRRHLPSASRHRAGDGFGVGARYDES